MIHALQTVAPKALDWSNLGAVAALILVLISIVRWMLGSFEKRMDSHADGLKDVAAGIHELAECVKTQQQESARLLGELIRINERMQRLLHQQNLEKGGT